MRTVRACVYIDGFNLYYSCLRGTPYRWLDLEALSRNIVAEHDLGSVRYFTARVKRDHGDPGAQTRQSFYLQALRTRQLVTVHEGYFRRDARWMEAVTEARLRRLVRAVAPGRWKPHGPQRVRVFKNEEKGSDVNLASYLLLDAFQDRYDIAVVISNDSDLVEPIRLVRRETGKAVWVISPYARISRLGRHATRTDVLDPSLLPRCQLPGAVRLPNGRIVHRPAEWA